MKVQVLGDGAFQDKMLAWRVRPPRQWDLDNQSASFGWIYEIKPVFIGFSRQAKLWGAWTWTVLEIIGNYFRYLSVDNGENWCSVTAAPAPWLGPVSETMQHVMIVIFSSQFNSFYSECESHLFYFPLFLSSLAGVVKRTEMQIQPVINIKGFTLSEMIVFYTLIHWVEYHNIPDEMQEESFHKSSVSVFPGQSWRECESSNLYSDITVPPLIPLMLGN